MIKKNVLVTIGLLLSILLCAGCGTKPATPAQAVELNVSAAVSLKDALAEIQTNYQANHPEIKLVYNLGASGALQKQIEQGAPADLFISAAPKQMDELTAKNLINTVSRKNLVENKLVLIAPHNSTLNLTSFNDLAQGQVKQFSMGEQATVPAGQYAQAVLTKLGIADAVKGKAVLAKDVRTVLAYVETGNVDAGIVYKTDAASTSKVKIVAVAPEGSHEPIVYPAAVLTTAKQGKAADEFLQYLLSPESKAVFEKYGFSVMLEAGK